MGKPLRIACLVVLLLVIAAWVIPDHKSETSILGYPCERGYGLRALIVFSLIFAGFALLAWQLFKAGLLGQGRPTNFEQRPFDPKHPFEPQPPSQPFGPFDLNDIGRQPSLQDYILEIGEPVITDLLQIFGVGVGAFICLVSLALC